MRELLGPTEVTISFSSLQDNDLCANQYIVLFCKYHSNTILPETVINTMDESKWMDLQERGFIKLLPEGDYALRQKAVDIFECSTPNTNWLEFLGKFPLKVPARNGGTRALKVANPDSKGNDRIKKKYLSLIKNNPELHKRIVDVLEAELEMRRQSSSLQYMHNMETWLNQADYDKYSYLLEENKSEDAQSGYGNEFR